jgi:hypothetical protein
MKRIVSIIVPLFVICHLTFVITAPAVAQFWPTYWIGGTVKDASDGTKAAGRTVIFYRSDSDLGQENFASAIIDSSNQYMLNTFSLGTPSLSIGETYYVSIQNDKPNDPDSGYGAFPVAVSISGKGFDAAPDLQLAKGAGPKPEPEPTIRLWINNRLYQPKIYDEQNPMIISATPKLQAKISIETGYAVAGEPAAYSITLDPETDPVPLVLTAANMVAKASAAGELKAFTMEYEIQESEKIDPPGDHVIEVTAQSAGTKAVAASSTLTAYVKIMSGPLQLVGIPISYPSPYSPSRDGDVVIQYTLSQDSNIEIYLISFSGERVKHFILDAGEEGGSAGINKVSWDGRTDLGSIASNGIYAGTIIARDENRLLGKFKLTVMN